VFSLWSVHGLYSYESRELVCEYSRSERLQLVRSSSRMESTEFMVEELRYSVVVTG
jgi:hypothetical protein